MKITYYTDRKIEILSIKADDGKPIREKAYHFGNCLIDLLYGHSLVDNGSVVRINERLKDTVTSLLEQCDDYLHNDIRKLFESDMSFIFGEKFSYQNLFIENRLCSVYYFEDIHHFISLLLTNVYLYKLIYKRCEHCKRLFATRFTNARFCKRIATKSGKTCWYAHLLKRRRKHPQKKR